MNDAAWRPTASFAAMRRRAAALRSTREFFPARGVLEVETPALVNAPVSDVNLGSVQVVVSGRDAPLFLHTSPEYAMKRLLAAGSGDIYQICRVFRGVERGRQHNPEFTMLEWYRLGFSLEELMREVGGSGARAPRQAAILPVEFVSYREALRRHRGLRSARGGRSPNCRALRKHLGFDARPMRARPAATNCWT